MTGTQRIVRIGIWLFLPFLLLGSLDLAFTLFSQFRQDRDVESAVSPDGRYAATLNVHQSQCGGTQTALSTSVFVERRFAGVKTGLYSPFCAQVNPAQLHVFWQNPRELLIACEGCSDGSFEVTDTNWGEVRFVFDLNR